MGSIPEQVGAYKVEREIGRGGMGVVYFAQDGNLERAAAIKTLPPELVSDPERLARFRSEARLLASLSHGNIASVYGLEEVDGQAFLALEYVDGQTLEARLQRGPIAQEDALAIALQIARGVEAAHENGVIHRDLKPGNIKIGSDGLVKVLDFGLAKARERNPDQPDSREKDEATTLAPGSSTLPGMIIGTPGYMSPEQAKGERVDARTDIWAFGCLLFEMLSGRSPFTGDSAPERLTSTLHHDPDWEDLPRDTPPPILRLLRRALTRDPRQRLQAIGDARLELEEISRGTTGYAASVPPRASGWRRLALPAVALSLVVITLALVLLDKFGSPPPFVEPLTRFELSLPEGSHIGWEGAATSLSKIGFSRLIAISPDGTRVVCTGQDDESTRLYLKETDGFRLEPIRGTEFARAPFFSPDGDWIGLIAGGVIKKVRLPGGPPEVICPLMSAAFDATWTASDRIIFSTDKGLWLVSANGGEPERLTTPDPRRDETGHHFPHIMPDQRSVLFTVSTTAGMHAARLTLDDGQWDIILRNAADARYVPSGHLVFAREDVVLAARFDPMRPEEIGGPIPLAETIHATSGVGGVLVSHFATSQNDALTYVLDQGPPDGDTLVWVDLEGRETAITTAPGAMRHPRLSPQGNRILIDIQTLDGMRDLYIYEMARGQTRRLTTDGQSFNSDWSSDGRLIAYCTGDTTGKSVCTIPTDFSGAPTTRLPGISLRYPHLSDVSPDGVSIVLWDRVKGGTWLLDFEGDSEPRELLNSNLDERWAEISPDGTLIAYVGTPSDRSELFVQSFPQLGPRVQVSIQGGAEPLWSRNGATLYFRYRNAVFAAPINRKPTLSAEPPRLLFTGEYDSAPVGHAHYEISRDDQRFLMVKHGESRRPRHLRMVENGIANLGLDQPAR